MDECNACGATAQLQHFEPESSVFADGSRLEGDALLCSACVGATTLRHIRAAAPAPVSAASQRREPVAAAS
jgi:hypothetical protein